jgi:nucleoside-diphosphate-sugar epimerase
MTHLLIFGLGYVGRAVAAMALDAGTRVTATTRSEPFGTGDDGIHRVPPISAVERIAEATHLLITAPPGEAGDPLLALPGAAEAIAASPLRWIGYFSTTGVYGDRDGAWVDETTAPAPQLERTHRRVAAEAAWSQFADRRAVDLFRLAGIYGPGRSALDEVRAGRARRVIKPGHQFGRIHRDDIARAVLVAMEQARGPGMRVLNLNDDEPAETAHVLEEAARLLGVLPPPAVPFAEAVRSMSPMARSFWAENRKVSNQATKKALGISWRYPNYREGLRAILAEERGEGLG